jgi:hypothetical protein
LPHQRQDIGHQGARGGAVAGDVILRLMAFLSRRPGMNMWISVVSDPPDMPYPLDDIAIT